MRISSHFSFFLSSAAAAALLAGCSGGGSMAPAANIPLSPQGAIGDSSASVPPPHNNQTIVSDSQNGTVTVYATNGHRQIVLTTGLNSPHGITTDAAENLYVTNTQGHNIVVYSQPYHSIGLTLDDANEYPTGVAVSNTGVVGVTNLQSVAGTGGNVVLYAKGSTSACTTIGDPNWSGAYFGAFDASGTLFITGFDRNGNTIVGDVSGGCGATSITTLSTNNTIFLVGGVQVYNGDILIEDQVGPGGPFGVPTPTIYTYAPPSGGSLGQPIQTTTLTAGANWIPVTFAMMKGSSHLWIAHSGIAAGRVEYTYPGGRLVKSIDDRSIMTPIGIAVNPASIPR